jgi:macrophage erythroblast attacher
LQDFIELCRKRDTVGAITYARKTLAPWASTHMHEIEQGMTLLAFGERTGVGAYRVCW